MPLIRENEHELHLHVDAKAAAKLQDLRIFRRQFYNQPPVAEHPGSFAAWIKRSVIEPYTNLYIGGSWPMALGAFSYSFSRLLPGLKIGRYCSIAAGLSVFGTAHPTEFVSTSVIVYDPRDCGMAMAMLDDGLANPTFRGAAYRPPPVIEHDVWIGGNVTLANGITIGTGAVLAANSVVTKSVEPYTIVGGNPARPIRRRFPDALCERLLESRWWTYKWTDLSRFGLHQPESFLDKLAEAVERAEIQPYAPAPIAWQDVKACFEGSEEAAG